jgi:hypothetical protein
MLACIELEKFGKENVVYSTVLSQRSTGRMEKTHETTMEVIIALARCDDVFQYWQSKSGNRFNGTAQLSCRPVESEYAAANCSSADPNCRLQQQEEDTVK